MSLRGVLHGLKSHASPLAIMAAVCLAAVPARGAETGRSLDIPAQSLDQALAKLAGQAETQLLYSTDLVRGLNGHTVKGEMTVEDALRALLAGTGLEAHPTGSNSFTIARAGTAARLDPVTVTAKREDANYSAKTATVGGKVPVSRREVANSVSVLTREQMDDQNLTDVDTALKWITGVDTRPNDGAQSQYYSRGFSLAFADDGMPSWTPSQGYQELDLAMYDRIEVLRGPAGLTQGSGEPAGVVNLVRKRPTDALQASMTASVGSWNNYRTTADISTPLNVSKTLKGRVVGTFTDRDFFYDNAHSQKWFGYGIVEYTPTPDWTFTYSSAYQDDQNTPFYGLPVYSDLQEVDFSRSSNPMASWSWMHWVTHDEKVEAEHRFANGWSAKIAGSWREQELDWKDGYPGSVNRATNTATYTLRDRSYQYYRKSADAFVNGPFRLFGREHNMLLGTNVSMFNSRGGYGNNLTVTGVDISNPSGLSEPDLVYTNGAETRATQFGQYGQLRFRVLDPLLVTIGGRNTNFDSDSRSMSSSVWGQWSQGAKAQNEFTPYAGAVIDITPQTSLYGSYSEIFVPQTNMTYQGSVLPPRVGWQAEMGLKNDFLDGKLNTTLAAFVLRDTNRAISDPGHTGYYIAAGEVESKGWEAEVAGSPIDNLKLTAGYTYLITQYLNSGSNTGNTFSTWEPRHSLKAWGIYSFDDGPLEGFSFGGGTIAKSQTYGTSHQLHQNAYAVFDAQIGYKINDNLSATLNAYNIFDNEYWAKILSTTNNFYGEPRSFVLSVKASL